MAFFFLLGYVHKDFKHPRITERLWIATALLIVCFALKSTWVHSFPQETFAKDIPSSDEEEATSMSTIVIRAPRWPTQGVSAPFKYALAQSTQFDSQDLEEQGGADVSELLSRAAGLQIVRTGGVGAAGSLYLRGADAAHTLVLLDGVRIHSASLGRAQFNLALPDQLEHIDVINGNVSALYGGGAIGGVVQLTTRQALPHTYHGDEKNNPSVTQNLQWQVASEYGSYHTQRQRIGIGGILSELGDTQFYIGASRFKTTGFSAMDPATTPGVNPGPDGSSNQAWNLSLQRQFDWGWEIATRLYEAKSTVSFDLPFGAPTDEHFSHNHLRVLSASAQGPVSEHWTTHMVLARSEDGNKNIQNGQFDSQFDTLNHQWTWRNEIALSPTQKGLWGYEYMTQALKASAYRIPGTNPRWTEPKRRIHSVFAGYVFQQGAHEMQWHARQDAYSDVGQAHSFYAGHRYVWSPQWQTSLSASNAFRAPSFNDLYYPDYGDTHVRPERSTSFEATVHHGGQADFNHHLITTHTRITAFQTRYRDLIESVQMLPNVYRAHNIGRAKVQGLEVATTARWRQMEGRMSGTIQNPIEDNVPRAMPRPSRDLPRRARHFASLAWTAPLAGWRVGGEWLISGKREDGGMPLHGYTILNGHAHYAFNNTLSIRARIDNVLNRHYQLAYGYQTPGRGAYVELVWARR